MNNRNNNENYQKYDMALKKMTNLHERGEWGGQEERETKYEKNHMQILN